MEIHNAAMPIHRSGGNLLKPLLQAMLIGAVVATLTCSKLVEAQTPAPAPVATPAPAPAPMFANVTQLLVYGGDYSSFLNLMIETKVDVIFQSMANNTKTGITIFAPTNEAFKTKLATTLLNNLTASQKVSLVEYHALNSFQSLGDLQNSHQNQTATLASYNNGGGRYMLNITFGEIGVVQVLSDWSGANLTSTVYSQSPVSIFAVNQVLYPEDIFGLPSPSPAPAPAPSSGAPSPSSSSSSSSSSGPSASSNDSGFTPAPSSMPCLVTVLLSLTLLLGLPLSPLSL